MAIADRNIKTNEKFVATFRGTKYVLQALKGEKPEKPLYRMTVPSDYHGPSTGSAALWGGDDGKTFTSLSSAASALAFPGRWDGWKFWTREKEYTPELAIKARGEVMKGTKRPKVNKAPKAVTAKKLTAKLGSGVASPEPSAPKAKTPATPKAAVKKAKVASAGASPKSRRTRTAKGSAVTATKQQSRKARGSSVAVASRRKAAPAAAVATSNGRGPAVDPAESDIGF